MFFTKEKCSCKVQELRIKELEDELNLEKTWAEGEIEFWKEEYSKLEQNMPHLRGYERFFRLILS